MTSVERLTEEIVSAPLGDIIASVGRGVAAAQQALDEASISATLALYESNDDERTALLKEIQYRPTFYALPETKGEVTIALSLGASADQAMPHPGTSPSLSPSAAASKASSQEVAHAARRARPALYATPVDAGFKNRFDYSGQISAKLTFTIVPVPSPSGLEDMPFAPDLVGLDLDEARALAESAGLEVVVDPSAGTDTPAGLVRGQSPRAGAPVLGDVSISLTFAGGDDES